jgi:hypothetical protein
LRVERWEPVTGAGPCISRCAPQSRAAFDRYVSGLLGVDSPYAG